MRALMKCLPLLSVALFPALLVAPVAAQQTASAGSTVQSFSQAELDAMLAPIALYPDTVLSHVLIASTYQLEIIKDNRWVEEHPRYSAEEAMGQVEDIFQLRVMAEHPLVEVLGEGRACRFEQRNSAFDDGNGGLI